MTYLPKGLNNRANRRSFIKKGLVAAGTATAGVGCWQTPRNKAANSPRATQHFMILAAAES